MFDGNRGAAQARRFENLEKRYDRLSVEYEALQKEKKALENELDIYRAKADCAKKAEEEYAKAAAQTRQIREQYERAYEDLKIIKARYCAEVNKLIKQIEH